MKIKDVRNIYFHIMVYHLPSDPTLLERANI